MLDTHIFLWFVFGDSLLNTKLRLLIEDKNNEKFWSMASVWEMAIKVSTGKFVLHQPVEPFIAQQLQREDFHLLPIALNHAARVSTMPFHHRDPFDRLIIAQGMVEQMPILSVDAVFDAYGCRDCLRKSAAFAE